MLDATLRPQTVTTLSGTEYVVTLRDGFAAVTRNPAVSPYLPPEAQSGVRLGWADGETRTFVAVETMPTVYGPALRFVGKRESETIITSAVQTVATV